MVKLTLKSDSADLLYTNPDYEVFHVSEKDYQSDTLILACTEDGTTKQILIPTDRIFLIKNIPFFEAMFRESSNWIEGNDDGDTIEWDNQKIVKIPKSDGSNLLAKKILLPEPIRPEFFAFYMKSLYANNIDIDANNCVDFYRVVDYFQDKKTLDVIIEFIKKNITFENSLVLMSMSNLFDAEIDAFYKNNQACEYLSKPNNLSKYLISLRTAPSQVFRKNMSTLNNVGLESSIFLKIIKSRINHFPKSIETILFISSFIIKRFSFNEKFVMYNHCVNIFQDQIQASKDAQALCNIYKSIYGDRKETREICQAISGESVDKVSLFKELCYDKSRINDKSNADKIRLLQDDPEVRKIIDHKTDCQLHKVELVEACGNGQIETVKALVDVGSDINAREHSGYSIGNAGYCRTEQNHLGAYFMYGPLTVACCNGHDNIVKYLLSQEGISLDQYYVKNKEDPGNSKLDALHAACRRQNNEKIIDLLMAKSLSWNFECIDDCIATMVSYVVEKITIQIFVKTSSGQTYPLKVKDPLVT